MALGETLTSANTKADDILSILESFVKQFYENHRQFRHDTTAQIQNQPTFRFPIHPCYTKTTTSIAACGGGGCNPKGGGVVM